jgi:HK97 family phage portal protein
MISWLMPKRQAIVNQDSYFEPFAHRTRAGIDINEDIALGFSTVFLCTRIICEPIAGLPILTYERDDDGGRAEVDPGTLAAQDAIAFPNDEITAYTFRESRTMHQVNWGGGFAELVRDSRGDVVEMWPIHPSRVKPGRAGSGYDYAVLNNDGTTIGMQRDEILHVCGPLSDDGIWSKGIITHARETVGGAVAMDRHAWAYLGSGGQPKGIFKSPGLRSPEDKREFRKQWKEIHGNPEQCEVVIAHKDSDYIPIQIPNDDHQFLQSRMSNRKIICELYRVPTYMIGDRVLGASIEAMSAEFVMNTLFPWIRKWEEQLGLKLLNRERRRRFFFEHDFTAMLRGNVADRMNGYRVQITTGVRTINECRRLENLPGIGPAGDIHYIPANMFTADQMLHGNPSAGGMAGPGSDHTGAPADNPLDHEPMMDARRPKAIHNQPNVRAGYNPDQPMDDHGRFGENDGDEATQSARDDEDDATQAARDDEDEATKLNREKEDAEREASRDEEEKKSTKNIKGEKSKIRRLRTSDPLKMSATRRSGNALTIFVKWKMLLGKIATKKSRPQLNLPTKRSMRVAKSPEHRNPSWIGCKISKGKSSTN